MPSKYIATLLLLFGTALPCFAGGIKGPLISDAFIDAAIQVYVVYTVFAHILGIVTFFAGKVWLRVVAGVLYAPVFIGPVIMLFTEPVAGVSGLLFALAFLILMIIIPFRNR